MTDNTTLLKVFGFLLVILVVLVMFIQLDKRGYFCKEGAKSDKDKNKDSSSVKESATPNINAPAKDGWNLAEKIARINAKQQRNLGRRG